MPHFVQNCISHPRFQIGDFGGGKFREGEAFPAKVFQRGADKIQHLVVDDEESVVEVLACAHGQSTVLPVEHGYVTWRNLVASGRCNYLNRHAFCFFRQQFQRHDINPAVYEKDGLLRAQDVFRGDRVARRIYAETAAKSSRRDESDLFQITDAPVVGLVQAT